MAEGAGPRAASAGVPQRCSRRNPSKEKPQDLLQRQQTFLFHAYWFLRGVLLLLTPRVRGLRVLF